MKTNNTDMNGEGEQARQHCECGNETYHIKRELGSEVKVWAECVECGRPTAVMGDGPEKQRAWISRNQSRDLE